MRVVDSIISQISEAIVTDNQIYKPAGGIGNFLVMKYKPPRRYKNAMRYLLKTGGWLFSVVWRNDKSYTYKFANRKIYDVNIFRSYHKKLQNHIIKLSENPYERDYSAPISK